MNNRLLLPLVVASAFSTAELARADTLRYVITGQEGMVASFEIDSRPVPDLIGIDNQFFKLKGVAIDYVADPEVQTAEISFYARSVDSGMAIYEELDPTHVVALFDGYGPHLYRGDVHSPTMKTGSFDFAGGNYHLMVSAVSPVPEPSSWLSMLAGGLGVAGLTLRRRAPDTAPA